MKIKINIPLLVLISPITLWVVCFIAIPMIYVLIVSFMSRGIYGGLEWKLTVTNYSLLTKSIYVHCFSISFIMSAIVTIIALLISYPFAMFLVKKNSIYKIILITILMIPFLTNSLLRIYGWILILRTNGILNEILEKIGLFSSPHTLLYTNPAIFVGLVYTLLPFMILPIYASLDKFDKSYLEASADLGATPFQTFWRVLFPMTIPGVFAGSIMVFIPSFGLFFIMDLLGGNKIMYLGNLIRNQFLTARNWPFGAALSMVLVFLTLFLIYIYKRAGGRMNQLVK